jgi:hypothetical protein
MPARTRRDCLTVLDHAANDESMATFRQALQDPVPRVRLTAVLGLDCQRRKASPLSGDDVVADLIGLAETDPSPKVRHAALVALAQRAGDPRVRLAAGKAARDEPTTLSARSPPLSSGAGAERSGAGRRFGGTPPRFTHPESRKPLDSVVT